MKYGWEPVPDHWIRSPVGLTLPSPIQLLRKMLSHFALDGLSNRFERDPVHALPCPIRRPLEFGVDRCGQAELERPVGTLREPFPRHRFR